MEIDKKELQEQIAIRMRIDNPWWTTGKIPEDIDEMLSFLSFHRTLIFQDQ